MTHIASAGQLWQLDLVDGGRRVLHPAQVPSMVDDVFYILRKCGLRVLASGSVQVG